MNKIDSNKLLSPSKNSAIQKKIDSSVLVPYKNIKISTKKINLGKKTEENTGSDDELIKTISSIKESLLQIESLLKSNSNILAKKLKRDKKDKENENRKEKETKLETKKPDKFPNLKTPNLPRTGILDYIKNFLTWVIIGRAFVLFSKYLPKLLEFVKYLTPLYDFVKTITGALFNGLVTFVEWTDKAQKKLKEVVGSLGGEPFQKAFDDFGGALTTFMNLALIAGMATMGGSDLGVGDALDDIDPDGKKPKGSRRRPGVTTSGGRRAGRPGLRNPLRQRPKITGTPGLRNPLRQRPKITGTPGLNNPLKQRPKITGATNAPANAPKLPPSAGSAGKLGAKALLKTVRPILRGMVIGGLIDFGLSVALGEDPGRAAFGAIGATLLGTIGGILGGPFAPFTAIGGGILGDWAGRKLYDAFFSGQRPTTSSKPQVAGGGMGGRRGGRGMQGGGSVQPKTGTPLKQKSNKNSTEKIKPPNILPAKKVKPGKDVGGEQKIKKLFPNTDPDAVSVEDWINAVDANGDRYTGTYSDFVESRRRLYKGKPNPFKALTRTSDILKRIPVVGTLMGAGVDAALGQAFDTKGVIEQFTSSMGYVVDSISKQQISNLENSIKTFSEGGSISASENISENYNQISSARLLEKLLGPSIERRVNRAVSGIKNDIEKAKTPEEIKREEEKKGQEDKGDIDPSLGTVSVSSDSPDFWLLVAAALFENGKPEDGYQGAADVAQAIYNRVSLPGWPKSIRGVILQPGQFQPVSDYGGVKEWEQINSKESAIAFAKKYKGYKGNIVEQIASTLLDRTKQENSRTFVGPRDNFRSESFEKKYNDLDNSTEETRYGHTFGFEPRGANIGKFKKGKLVAAEVNKKVVTGTVTEKTLEAMVTGGIKPSEIELTSRQGWRDGKMHKGIDLDGGDKSPISSAQDAKVVHAGWIDDGYGYSVILKYSNGAETRFAHLDSVNVRTGQSIKAGQLIGKQGNTGASRGSHLHFEYYPRGGAMTYEGYGNAFSVKDSYFRYGGNVKAKVVDKSDPNLLNYQDKISKMKLGDAPYEVPGVGKVIIKKNQYGTIVKEYYDTNGNIIDSSKFFDKLRGKSSPPKPSAKTSVINASTISFSNLNSKISNLKTGEKIVFDKVGSIQAGKGWLGGSQIKYYNSTGTPINKEEFDKLLAPSNVLRIMKSNDQQLQNLQGGGNINMNYKNIQRPTGLNTYEDEENTVVYIQPVYFIPDQNQTYIKSPSPMMVSSGSFVRSSSYIP